MTDMDKRTITALRGSIAKWEAIVDGSGEDEGPNNCPLCEEFRFKWPQCGGCPVAEHAGNTFCEDTPYVEWDNYSDARRVTDERSRKLAQAELDFLRSLLPVEDT